MAGSRMNKRLCIFGIALLITCIYGWARLLFLNISYDLRPRPVVRQAGFSTATPHETDWYMKECFGSSEDEIDISNLEDFSGRWKVAPHPDCSESFKKFTNIYSISRRAGQIVIPETFQTKVLKWLGNNEELLKEAKLQFITAIFNQYTHESSIFNPLRSKRPGVSADTEDLETYIEELLSQSQSCDFCDYKFKTAEDTFGRIESEHTVTAANTFKYDAYHAIIILKSHHPLRFSEEQFLDMFDVTMKWFMKVHSTDKQYRYPHIMWDCLPKASASQIHPHSQVTLSPVSHYGLMEHIRLSAVEYGISNGGQNYFNDLIQIHTALGLTTSLGDATAMAYLTPKKDYEVMILSKTGGQDFIRLLYYTIRAFIDDMQLYAWSLAVFLPKLEPYSTPAAEDIPAVARIISRGPPTNPRNDISSMELFAASNVNIDPFSVIEHIKKSVEVKGHLQAGDLKKIAERKERLQQEMNELEKRETELEMKENNEKDPDIGDPRGGGGGDGGGDGAKREETKGAMKDSEDIKDDARLVQRPQLANPPLQNVHVDGQRVKDNRDDPAVAKVDGMDGDRDEDDGGHDDEDHEDVEERHIERRDTIRRVDWPGNGDGVADDNLDNT